MLRSFREAVWEISHRTPPFRGKERLVRLISHPGRQRASTIVRSGVRWAIFGHDGNEFTLAIRKFHSEAIMAWATRRIAAGGVRVVWDVGANLGTFSLPLLARHPDVRAVLFEASAEVAGRLVGNLSLNPELVGRARLLNVALASEEGVMDFYVSNEPANSGTAGLGTSHNRTSFAVGVQARTGDGLVASGACEAPDLIKIDVEGFELEVLRGMRGLLAARHPPVVFEHCTYRIRERGMTGAEVVGLLRELGYTIRKISTGREVTDADLSRDDDFFAEHA